MHVTLSGPTYAGITDGSATGRIVNDDTTVRLGLRQGSERRVWVTVLTGPARPGAPVKVFRVLRSGYQQMLSTQLDSRGRISVLLPSHYRSGQGVTMYARVSLPNGRYASPRVHITIS